MSNLVIHVHKDGKAGKPYVSLLAHDGQLTSELFAAGIVKVAAISEGAGKPVVLRLYYDLGRVYHCSVVEVPPSHLSCTSDLSPLGNPVEFVFDEKEFGVPVSATIAAPVEGPAGKAAKAAKPSPPAAAAAAPTAAPVAANGPKPAPAKKGPAPAAAPAAKPAAAARPKAATKAAAPTPEPEVSDSFEDEDVFDDSVQDDEQEEAAADESDDLALLDDEQVVVESEAAAGSEEEEVTYEDDLPDLSDKELVKRAREYGLAVNAKTPRDELMRMIRATYEPAEVAPDDGGDDDASAETMWQE